MMQVWVAGRKVKLDPSAIVGQGGEAEVYDIGQGEVLKLYKAKDHPDIAGNPGAERAAEERLAEHQSKLRAFPGALPPHVVGPTALATTRDGSMILGYSMRRVEGATPLSRLADRGGRPAGLGGNGIGALLVDLHRTVARLHRGRVVIGDFNDLNVLVTGERAHLIDADSFQFGPFVCRMFTERFVDPRLCDPSAERPVLTRSHDADSDWYAFAVLAMRSLLCVDPFGGIYKPAAGSPRVTAAERPLRRISVFHPDVRYPKPAFVPETLSDDLLHTFTQVFGKDRRGEFPRGLIENLSFRTCAACGLEHARALCPHCAPVGPRAAREVLTLRGRVEAALVYQTRGQIVSARLQGRGLELVVREAGRLWREGPWGRAPEEDGVVRNSHHAYWVEGGRLLRDSPFGPERIGDVLAGHTRVFVGERFGLGFYRAGALFVGFVFDAQRTGLDDGVSLPRISGQLVDTAATFTDERCFFFATFRDGARLRNRVVVVRRDGGVEATAEADVGDGSWLGGIEGRAAAGRMLFAPTDEGLVRVSLENGSFGEIREFSDTEPFVDAASRLLAGSDGLYVVGRSEVRRLRMA